MESKRCFASLNMTRFHASLRASSASAAINEQQIPTHQAFKTFDCFASLAMTIVDSRKIPNFISFVKGDTGLNCEAAPLSPLTIPQTPARFLKVCAPHGLCQCPTALRLCDAFGSSIDVARCGWEFGIGEQWQRDVSASPQHDNRPSLRASCASAAIKRHGIPIRLIASLRSQ